MELTQKEFHRLSGFIYAELGIKMPEAKQTMLSGRLQKRLRTLKLGSYGEYCDFLFSAEGMNSELMHLFDAVTTNKTDFFREPAHYDILTRRVLPELIRRGEAGVRRTLRLWSAGCSSGEEPYTLTMVLRDVQQARPELGFQFEILATDISTRVLEIARKAIYPQERIAPVPPEMRRRYLLRGKGAQQGMVRVAPENRALVRFGRLNFMDDDFGLDQTMDIIFCRNVIIYFDKPTQERLMNKFCRHLHPGGYLFVGHSESLHGFRVPLVQVAPTVYQKL